MTRDQAEECRGASGRKLKRTCIYCPNYERYWKKKGDDNNGCDGLDPDSIVMRDGNYRDHNPGEKWEKGYGEGSGTAGDYDVRY